MGDSSDSNSHPRVTEYQFLLETGSGTIPLSGEMVWPISSFCLLVLGHGAGAGINSDFMSALAWQLGLHSVGTFRYQFPYMEAGRKLPDRQPVLVKTVASAVSFARSLKPGVPLVAGGKSMGGRMSSIAVSEGLLDVEGLVFFGFPLHPARKPSVERAKHLKNIECPMLFLQGTRDSLADSDLISGVVRNLGNLALLDLISEADHSFRLPKRVGRSETEVIGDLARKTSDWLATILHQKGAG